MKPILSPDGEVTNARDIALHLETVSPRWRALNTVAVDTAPFEHWKYLALSLGLDVAEQERKDEEFRKAIFGDCEKTMVDAWSAKKGLPGPDDQETHVRAHNWMYDAAKRQRKFDEDLRKFDEPPSRAIPLLLTGLGLAAAIAAGAFLVKGQGEAAVVMLIITIACGMRASRTPV